MSMSTESHQRTDIEKVQTVPASWTVKAEAWCFITSLGHRVDPEQGEWLPNDYFHYQELQFQQIGTDNKAFRGGRGSITLLRYTDTPIGPFDELAISPGEFTNPFDEPSHRVTRAYASTLPAVLNGRANWGLPRELAQFFFQPSLDHEGATEVHVYPATSYAPVQFAQDRVFAMLVRPVRWFPALPASLGAVLFPPARLFQPPLAESPAAALDGRVGSAQKWHALECAAYKGRARPFRCEGLLRLQDAAGGADDDDTGRERVCRVSGGNGIGFPDVLPYSIGVHWKEVEMTLPQAVPLASL